MEMAKAVACGEAMQVTPGCTYWYGDILQPSGPAVFVNGCLRWLDEIEFQLEIWAFDSERERSRNIKMPDPNLDGDYVKLDYINIGIWETLYIFCSTWYTNVFDIWLLQDYANDYHSMQEYLFAFL